MRRQDVMVKEPHIKSQAALVLLCKAYKQMEMKTWLGFRESYLDQALEEFGFLECAYCGRKDLVKDYESVRQPANLATIDHVQPLSKGGSRYDPENLVIACYRCNQHKGNS